MDAAEKVKWLSRDAKRFIAAKPDFDATPEYESDVADLVTCHPSWVCGESDLSPLGREVRAYLQANPELIHQ